MSSIRAFTFSDINDILIERDEDDEYEEEFEDVGEEEEEEELARQTPQSTPSSSPSSALLLASRRSEALGKVVEFTFDAVAGEEGGSPRGARESQQSDGSRSTSERWEDEASDYNEKVLAAVASRAAASPTTTTTTATAAAAAAAAAVPTLPSQNTASVPSPGAKGDLLKSLNSALLAERHPKPAATLGAASKAAAAVSAPSSSSGSGGSGRIFSRVHKASPHEIPGYKENVPPASLFGASTHFSATSPPYASASTGPSRHEVVSAILQCLTAATGTAKTNTERKAAIAQGAVSVPTLKMGLTKVQALQASGKLFHRDVADYDPDYDEAVELLQEEQALAQQYRPEPQPAPAAPAPAAAAPRAGLAPPTVLSREFEVRQASALSSIRPLISPSGPARLVAPRFSSASASASASARTAASVTFANVGVEGEGREQALQRASGGSSSSRADLSATCESVYASFLSDLVGVCRARAEHCQSAAEMAMLRVLSEQVKEVFAGEEMDALHAKMISAAASVNKGSKR